MCRILWTEDETNSVSGYRQGVIDYFAEQAIELDLVKAKTREEAWNHLEEGQWDLVVLDLMLPNDEQELESELVNMSAGLDLLRRYHKSINGKLNRAFPIIVFTALLEPETEEEVRDQLMLEDGRDLYIEKTEEIDAFMELFVALWEHEEHTE